MGNWSSENMWLYLYFPISWAGCICMGLAMGIIGPTQPYLAQNVGVQASMINFIWTGRSVGTCLAAVFTGIVFKLYIRKPWQKLLFLSLTLFFSGSFFTLVPWTSQFSLLLAAVLGSGINIGSFNTASSSLVVYMLGPDRSRPFIQSLHAFIGLGFILGSLIVRPFLPEHDNIHAICGESLSNFTSVTANYSKIIFTEEKYIQDNQIGNVKLVEQKMIPDIAWPFLIIGIIHIVVALSFFIIVAVNIPMPRYYDIVPTDDLEKDLKKLDKERVKYPKCILFLSFFFFAFSGGLEGFFQSQTYTFGICGPHSMSSNEAVSLTTLFFACFLSGRFSGIFFSTRLKPTTMILVSLTGCLLGTFLLAVAAQHYHEVVFIGTGMVGFFISVQIATGYSWLAELVDLTGKASSLSFLGCNSGWLVFPPLAGMVVFSNVGPMGVYYLSIGLTSVHIFLFLLMIRISRIRI